MLEIRQENKNDYEQVYNVVKKAFEMAEESDGNEQDLVVALRNSESFIPELSLVEIKDNKIVANFTTPLETNSLDNNNFEFLFISGENKSIKINLKLNEIENLYFVMPEKYLTTRTQIGGGIKPEMIIEMLESIVNERLHTK